MSDESVTSLDDGRKAPFTESTCEGILDNIDTQSSVGITNEMERARLEVSLSGLTIRVALLRVYPLSSIYQKMQYYKPSYNT